VCINALALACDFESERAEKHGSGQILQLLINAWECMSLRAAALCLAAAASGRLGMRLPSPGCSLCAAQSSAGSGTRRRLALTPTPCKCCVLHLRGHNLKIAQGGMVGKQIAVAGST
jgi:hypothetical protein